VQSIEFGWITGKEHAPLVRIILNGRSEFSLTRKGDKLYVLALPHIKLGYDHLKLPQFPPRDFAGITVVSAAPVGDGSEVSVYVEQGVRIGAASHENEIWVRPLNK
jgi:hypothetical protein